MIRVLTLLETERADSETKWVIHLYQVTRLAKYGASVLRTSLALLPVSKVHEDPSLNKHQLCQENQALTPR